ncbi:MAG: hypothetical protein GXP55_00475 [Deltaproteobacteria bacterium]|nr:hypothetical protein [Deltaproteobacteria bacterium]
MIDDGPLGTMAQVFNDQWSWPTQTLHVLDAVARGARLDKSGRRAALLEWGQKTGAIVRHTVCIGSDAEAYLAEHLRPDSTIATADLGEHESIAWMRHEADDDSMFVTVDKSAAYLALVELGPSRIASPFDLWSQLTRTSCITREDFELLCERAQKAWNLRFPLRLREPA